MLSKFSVKKPFVVVVGIIVVLILGFVSYRKMTIDLLPSMNMPYALGTTAYAGASPEEAEQSMDSVGSLKSVSSVSSENSSLVVLEFAQDTNMDAALIEMRESLDLMPSYLPDGAGSPIIMKMNPDMMPVMAVSAPLEGEDLSHSSQTIQEKIVPELESVGGVAPVSVQGALENMAQVTPIDGQKVDKVNKGIGEAVRAAQQKAMKEALAQQHPAGGMTGMPISIVSFVGIIMLAGIVVNNGIVFVDYANRLRADGMEKREALVTAGRPILMTALTAIIALLTTCLDSSANASMMQPMAVTVVGGLVYATLLTFYFVPVLYDLFVRKSAEKEEK